MIILAPHALAHHLLVVDDDNDDDDTSTRNVVDDDTRNVDNGAASNNSCGECITFTSCNEDAESITEKIMLHTSRRREEEEEVVVVAVHPHRHHNIIIIRQDRMQQWLNARLKISLALGSIGAPPLMFMSSSLLSGDNKADMLADNHDITPPTTTTTTTTNPEQAIIDETQSSLPSSSPPFNIYLDHIIEMAMAHTQLLQTISRILEVVCDASSIQLGIGPTIMGSCGLVPRAENAWIARQRHLRLRRKEQQKKCRTSNNMEAQCRNNMDAPTLTLQKLRNILHRAIVDQAISLLEMLKQSPPETSAQQLQQQQQHQQQQHESIAEWNIYVHDLRHSLQLPSSIILTLSQLSYWRQRNGELLSWVLSNHFLAEEQLQLQNACLHSKTLVRSDDDCHDNLSTIAMAPVLQSMQFARERIVYLHSACPLSRPSTSEIRVDIVDDHDGVEECSRNNAVIDSNDSNSVDNDEEYTAGRQKHHQRRIQRQAEHIIGTLQANLEAARITLWAFGQSYSECTTRDTITANDEDDDDDDRTAPLANNHSDVEDREVWQVWWSRYKDIMERSYAIMSEFDEHFQSTTASCQGAEEGMEANNVGTSESSKVDGCVATEWSDHVVDDATGIDDENLLPCNGCLGAPSKSQHAGKTLVFSGSGIKTPSQLLHTKRLKSRSSSASASKQGIPPRELNVVDQVVLLQDLERRIKTMGLIDEYEVTRMDEELDSRGGNIESAIDGEDRGHHVNRIATASNRTTTNTRNHTFTLSGSLLAELKSTIHGNIITTCEEDDQSLSLA